MSLAVWKYTLLVEDHQDLTLPRTARILTVREQLGVPRLWALVDPAEHARGDFRTVRLRTVGTGHPLEGSLPADLIGGYLIGSYLGSYQLVAGNFVGHVFLE